MFYYVQTIKWNKSYTIQNIHTSYMLARTLTAHTMLPTPAALLLWWMFNNCTVCYWTKRKPVDKKQNTVYLFTHLSHLCFSWVFNEIRRQIKILLHQLYFLAQGVVRDVYLSIQGNLDITRSDITKSCYNKVILKVQTLYIFLFLHPDIVRNLI